MTTYLPLELPLQVSWETPEGLPSPQACFPERHRKVCRAASPLVFLDPVVLALRILPFTDKHIRVLAERQHVEKSHFFRYPLV